MIVQFDGMGLGIGPPPARGSIGLAVVRSGRPLRSTAERCMVLILTDLGVECLSVVQSVFGCVGK